MIREVHIKKIHDRFGRSKAAAMARVRIGRKGKYILIEDDDFKKLMAKTIHGAGDVVKRAAQISGVDKAVKKFLPGCNCDQRQKRFNQAIPL